MNPTITFKNKFIIAWDKYLQKLENTTSWNLILKGFFSLLWIAIGIIQVVIVVLAVYGGASLPEEQFTGIFVYLTDIFNFYGYISRIGFAYGIIKIWGFDEVIKECVS